MGNRPDGTNIEPGNKANGVMQMSSFALYTSNRNRSARPVRGASIVQRRRLNKSQLAVICADVLDGLPYRPTRVELSASLGVSVPLIAQAQRLSPAARERITKGEATLATFKSPGAVADFAAVVAAE